MKILQPHMSLIQSQIHHPFINFQPRLICFGVIDINREETITSQSAIDEFQHHQTPGGKYKVKISLQRRKIYNRKDLEDIQYRFGQSKPVVSHLEFRLPDKPITPKNIDEALKCPHRKFYKEALFVKYDKNKKIGILLDPIPIKYLPDETKVIF